MLASPNSVLQLTYRRGHSAETALLHVINSVFTAANNKKATTLVGLDISAAFDTIDPDTLLSCLCIEFGVDGKTFAWLRSYPSDRQQFVKLEKHASTTTQSTCGVSQGSVFAPLLFLTAYASPVGDLIESFGLSYRFADDTQLFVARNAADSAAALDSLSRCSAAVRLWFLRNGLQLNADKSEVIIVGTSHQLSLAKNTRSIDVAGSLCQSQTS